MRVRQRPADDYGRPPAILAKPSHVEDWLSADEVATLRARAEREAKVTTVNTSPAAAAEILDQLGQLAAYRKWQAARLEWLDEHGVPDHLEGEMLPHRRPPQWRALPR